jgi:hypothetical protein
MKMVVAEGKRKLVMNKVEWTSIGKTAGWMPKKSAHSETIVLEPGRGVSDDVVRAKFQEFKAKEMARAETVGRKGELPLWGEEPEYSAYAYQLTMDAMGGMLEAIDRLIDAEGRQKYYGIPFLTDRPFNEDFPGWKMGDFNKLRTMLFISDFPADFDFFRSWEA